MQNSCIVFFNAARLFWHGYVAHHYAAKVTSIRLLLYYGCMQKRFYRACVITTLLFTSVEDFTTLKDTSRSAFLPRHFLPYVSLYLPASVNTQSLVAQS